jgi:hypothetical protein
VGREILPALVLRTVFDLALDLIVDHGSINAGVCDSQRLTLLLEIR